MVTPEKTEQLADERLRMAEKYEKLAIGLEIKFTEALDLLNLPERPAPSDIKSNSSFNWIRVN